jgi:hypothetical protein
LFIVKAILQARTEYIIYFLLAAWLEALEHDGRARAVPLEAKRLPVRGAGDVSRRLAAVREKLDRHAAFTPAEASALEDAAAALSVACLQLRELSTGRETAQLRKPYARLPANVPARLSQVS